MSSTAAGAARDMSADDARYWQAVQDWKTKRFSSATRRLVPEKWRTRASAVTGQARERAGATSRSCRVPKNSASCSPSRCRV